MSFNHPINKTAHSSAKKQNKIAAMKKSPNENERKVADKKLRPSAKVDVPSFLKNEVSLVDKIVEEIIQEKKNKGLWSNIHAKRKRGESPAKPGDKNYPKTLNVEEKENKVTIEDADGNTFLEVVDLITPDPLVSEGIVRIPAKTGNIVLVGLTWRGRYHSIKMFFPQTKFPTRTEVQNEIEKVYPGARVYSFNVSEYEPGKPMVQVSEGASWTKKEGKNESGGLNEKGRRSYEKENPGSDLKAPSKEVGNPRRASFCRRMKGMKTKLTSKKTANDPDSRINKSLRAWNC
jgi:hypothetical protein